MDACLANIGSTVETIDHRSACLVTLDGETCTETDIIGVQIKRAAVLSVERGVGLGLGV